MCVKKTGAALLALLFFVLLASPLALAAEKKEKLSLVEFIRRIPTRAADRDATPGDMVNFVIVGSREQLLAALTAADWRPVDRTVEEAAVNILISILNRQVYTALPMSELFLFERPQDFGFARADPLAVIVERHHFRLWEAPWQTDDGRDLWLGAGTHDVGIEEDQRTGDPTHRIDPEVDREREFIGLTLYETGLVEGVGYITPPEPVREASTAHGGPYASDGRILVIVLKDKRGQKAD